MITKVVYECSICGKRHDVESECHECEKKHKQPIEIHSVRHVDGDVYPLRMEIKFDDGSIRHYHLTSWLGEVKCTE